MLSFVGSTAVKYIPVNETVEMELGADREVLVKPMLMNWVKTDLAFDQNGNVKGWTTKETWEIEVQNSRAHKSPQQPPRLPGRTAGGAWLRRWPGKTGPDPEAGSSCGLTMHERQGSVRPSGNSSNFKPGGFWHTSTP